MTQGVFISYSRKDRSVADAVCAALETSGIRCWIAPRDVTPGASSADAITGAIEASRVLLSHASNKADDVFREISLAALWGIPIVAYRIDRVKPTGRIGQYVDSCRRLDATHSPHATSVPDLATTVELLLKRDR